MINYKRILVCVFVHILLSVKRVCLNENIDISYIYIWGSLTLSLLTDPPTGNAKMKGLHFFCSITEFARSDSSIGIVHPMVLAYMLKGSCSGVFLPVLTIETQTWKSFYSIL